MSKAREIAEERLAKGEISKTEFDEIVGALSGGAISESATSNETPNTDQAPRSDGGTAPQVKEIEDLRTLLHNGGGFLAMVGTALLATVFFRMIGNNYEILETSSIMSAWSDNGGGGIIAWVIAIAAIWFASFFAVGALSVAVKASIISAVNKTEHPQNTLAELARQDAKRDDSFREQHIIHAMPGEPGDVAENQYQTKIRNVGAFIGAILIFVALSSLFGAS